MAKCAIIAKLYTTCNNCSCVYYIPLPRRENTRGKWSVLTKVKRKSCKIQFATWKLRSVGTNKCKSQYNTYCTKAHISAKEKLEFPAPEKCRCFGTTLKITHYRKSYNWSSFNFTDQNWVILINFQGYKNALSWKKIFFSSMVGSQPIEFVFSSTQT